MSQRTSTGRPIQTGRLATTKHDFNMHVDGSDFRHTADNINMETVLPGFSGTTVQETLEEMQSSIGASGTGFISVGIVGGNEGTYNVGAVGLSTFKAALLAAFDDDRLASGGVVLILAGTYTVGTTSINVPAGITLMGELEGTIINCETSELPMFIIENGAVDTRIGGDSGSGTQPADSAINLNGTKFYNLTLTDNIDGTAAGGDSCLQTVPMIQCKVSSNFICQNVKFIGRLNAGTVSGRSKTFSAIGYTSGGTAGTNLRMEGCYFDAVRIAISFLPGNNEKDTLVVNQCRARTYGTENASDLAVSKNCFINMSHANAVVTNNFHIGTGSQVNTFISIASGSGSLVRYNVTGNTGTVSATSHHLISNSSSSTFTGVITGNNWGTAISSPWYIVVGGSDNDSPLGDFFGVSAIDRIFTIAATSANFDATIIVNPGNYTVTVGTNAVWANLKFIGNKKGTAYPVLTLSGGAGSSDSLGNKFIVVGNHLESIYFRGITTGKSIRPAFNATSASAQTSAHTLVVKDCIFYDCSLNLLDIQPGIATDGLGFSAFTNVIVEDCQFFQSGTLAHNLDVVIPRVTTATIKNCTFNGKGYAISLGSPTYSSNATPGRLYTLENLYMVCTGINAIAPGTAEDNYIIVKDDEAKIVLKDCKILVSETYSTASVLTVSGGQIEKYVYLQGREIIVDGCVINSSSTSFTSGGIQHQIPAIFAEPGQSCKITNNRFVNGGPLQIGGPLAFASATLRDGILIEGNQFLYNSSANGFSVMLDIDVDATVNADGMRGSITVVNNIFHTMCTNAVRLLHTEQTDSYDAKGIVQIYAPYFDIFVEGNKIGGKLTVPASSNPYSHVAGLVINNWNATTGTDGTFTNAVQVHNNSIEVINNFAGTLSTQSASCLWIKAPIINITGNYFALINSLGVSTLFVGCLYIEAQAADTYGAAIVAGNIFSRRVFTGDPTNLIRGYILIGANSESGQIVDNAFSDSTYDGSTTALVEDNSAAAKKWTVSRNKNQQEELKVVAVGKTAIVTSALSNSLVLSGDDPSSSIIYSNSQDIDDENFRWSHVVFLWQETSGTQADFYWTVNLQELLPYDVRIVKIDWSYDIITGVVPATTKTLTLSLRDYNADLEETDPVTVSVTTAVDRTFTPTETFINTSANSLLMNIKWSCNHTSTTDIALKVRASITYKW